MNIRVLYCHHCGWQYPENAAKVGTINQCGGDCGQSGLWFIAGDDQAPIIARLHELGLRPPAWLNALRYSIGEEDGTST